MIASEVNKAVRKSIAPIDQRNDGMEERIRAQQQHYYKLEQARCDELKEYLENMLKKNFPSRDVLRGQPFAPTDNYVSGPDPGALQFKMIHMEG